MNANPYSPSATQASWELYRRRDQEREDESRYLEAVEALVAEHDFRDRLILFLDDLTLSSPEATLSDLPHPYQVYFQPNEMRLLSGISFPNPRSPTKEVLSSFSQVSKYYFNLVQRYRHPEKFTESNRDESDKNLHIRDRAFQNYMSYLRNGKKCIPGTLIWKHEEKYQQMVEKDREEEEILMKEEQEQEQLRKRKEEMAKESRKRAAEKRKATLATKKLLAEKEEVKEAERSTSCETIPATDETSTSATRSDKSTPPTEISTAPVHLTPAEKRKQTMERKRLEREAEEAKCGDGQKFEDEISKPKADPSDGPSSSKKIRLNFALPRKQKTTLKLKTEKTKVNRIF